ncbi:winged helix-turn-helix transcriptional regulator [Chitinophaga sp.]|uniref:winged helix-turn-helix transcriptional regulator n=1 Tax=Chitinophaga sp. TaxID=1869181 RepID=UPI002F92E403
MAHKMLTSQLRELGMVEQIIFRVAPPKVEYKITATGMLAIPVIGMIMKYGMEMMGVDPPAH